MNARSKFALHALTIALAIAALVPSLAFAAPGAGIDKGAIPAPQPALPGVDYELETLTIYNTGDEPATFEMLVVPVNKADKLDPDSAWFTFTPQQFDLAPGSRQTVQVQMALPGDTAPGEYEALLGGRPIRNEDGVFVNVGAAARYKMVVSQPNAFLAAYYGTLGLISGYAPWSYLVIAAVLVAIALTVFLVLRRRAADEYDEDDDDLDEDAQADI